MKFEQWWGTGTRSPNNPYKADSPAFWAWEGWQAGVGIERQECAKLCVEVGEDLYEALMRESTTNEQVAKDARAATWVCVTAIRDGQYAEEEK